MPNPYQPISTLNSAAPNFGLLRTPGNAFNSQNNAGTSMSTATPTTSGPVSMGVKVSSPESNIKPSTNVAKTPAGQTSTATVSTPSGTGNTSQTAAPVNSGLFGQANQTLYNTGTQGSAAVNAANQGLLNFQQNYSNLNAGIQGDPNYSLDTQQGKAQVLNNQYSQQLPAYQQNVANALAGQSQQIGALGTVAGQTNPVQVSPGNFYVNPLNGEQINGAALNPGAGGARQEQVTQGSTAQANIPKINTAAGYVNNFNTLLQSSGLQQSDVNVANLLNNVYASNTSNPAYPQLQSLFNNAINFYAQALGEDPNQLISTLATTGNATSLSALFQNLDGQARQYNSQLQGASTGNPTPVNVQPVQPTATQQNNSQTTIGTGNNAMTFKQNSDGSYTRVK